MPDNDPRYRTIDHAPITPGLVVWDYDLRVSEVAPFREGMCDPGGEYWDGFFAMRDPVTGGRMSSMTGDRMWVRHPRTGKPAS